MPDNIKEVISNIKKLKSMILKNLKKKKNSIFMKVASFS